MVAIRRKSDRPAVSFSVTTYYYYGQTRYPMVTQNEHPVEDRENQFLNRNYQIDAPKLGF